MEDSSGTGASEDDALRAFANGVELARADALDPTPENISALGSALIQWAIALFEADRPDESLIAADEAVSVLRGLPRDVLDDGFALASALGTQAALAASSGRFEAASVPAAESVALFRELGNGRGGEFSGDLARSLDNQANILAETSRAPDAIVLGAEAVELWRSLAIGQPAEYAQRLALSLSNQAARFAQVGQVEAALVPAEEAASIWQGFAELDPAEFSLPLADALQAYGRLLRELGREPEAAVHLDNAAGLYTALGVDATESY